MFIAMILSLGVGMFLGANLLVSIIIAKGVYVIKKSGKIIVLNGTFLTKAEYDNLKGTNE